MTRIALALLLCASWASALPPGVRIKGDAGFKKRALGALDRLKGTKTGARLLSELAKTGKTVTLREGGQETSGAVLYPTTEGDSAVLWDPGYALEGFPAFVFLYHELVHALHEARGERDSPGKADERRTVGIGEFAGYPLSENALREELGLPKRKTLSREEFVPSAR